jgi:hypothetical protein
MNSIMFSTERHMFKNTLSDFRNKKKEQKPNEKLKNF